MLLNRIELCEAFGVSDSAITAWEKKGMPVVRKGRGRGMKSIYDYDKVKAWCSRTGMGSNMQALFARMQRAERATPIISAGAVQRPVSASDVALAIALARVDTFEDYAEDPEESKKPTLEPADAICLFIYFLGCRLAEVGMPEVSRILDGSISEDAFEGDWAQLLARAKTEVPGSALNG